MIMLIFGIILIVAGLIILYLSHRSSSKTDLYSLYVDSQSVSELSAGVPAFFSGTVTTTQPLQTPYSRQPCVYYSYRIEEYRETRDVDGRTSHSWETVDSGMPTSVPFWIQKPDGYVAVDLRDANIDGAQTNQQQIQTQVQGMGAVGDVVNAFGALNDALGGGRRVIEFYVPLNSQQTIGGQVFEENNQITFRNDSNYPLILTNKNKETLLQSKRRGSALGYGTGVALLIAGVVFTALHFK